MQCFAVAPLGVLTLEARPELSTPRFQTPSVSPRGAGTPWVRIGRAGFRSPCWGSPGVRFRPLPRPQIRRVRMLGLLCLARPELQDCCLLVSLFRLSWCEHHGVVLGVLIRSCPMNAEQKSRRDSNLGPPALQSGALTTRLPRRLANLSLLQPSVGAQC